MVSGMSHAPSPRIGLPLALHASILLLMLAMGARSAPAQTGVSQSRPISELTRILGQHENELIGLGIVVGLNGTGDEIKGAASRPFRELLKNLGNAVVNMADLGEGGSFAIVQVSATIPGKGASEGSRINVRVDTLFDATDLRGGRLVPSLLRPPVPDRRDLAPLAVASGDLIVNANDLTSGRIRDGAMMIADVRPQLVSPEGVLTLVLHPAIASHANAQAIADAINEPEGYDMQAVEIARADESGTIVRITLPLVDRATPAKFISYIEGIAINASLLQEVARIVIDRSNGIIVATNAVTVRPGAIAMQSLGVRVAADPGPWQAIGSAEEGDKALARLNDLLATLEQLLVPVDDQIELIHNLKAAGAITAEIVEI